MSKKILISCGELSADEHAARLVPCLKELIPGCEIKAMGGRNLRQAGVETIIDSETSASVMGFTELFGSIFRILKSLKLMKSCISEWKPDLLILIDFPDFNMKLAKHASNAGTKTLYFISPQVWAWRSGRVELFKKYIDRMAVIFPFEKAFLENQGYKSAEFVGHPFLDHWEKREKKTSEEIRNALNLSDKPILAVFPGSRKQEIEKHLTIMLAAIKKISDTNPDVQIVINVAPSLETEFIMAKMPEVKNLIIVKRDPLDIMQIANAGLLKSGTSNLQAAVLGLPFCMFYIASPVSAFIVRNFVKIKQYSIVNILKPGTIREFLQEDTSAAALFKETSDLLYNENRRLQLRQDFDVIRESLRFPAANSDSAYYRTAKLAKTLMS